MSQEFKLELKKLFIVMFYIKEREPVAYLATLMKNGGQDKVAENLLKFNKTEEFIPYSKRPIKDWNISVRKATVLRGGVLPNGAIDSCRFDMSSSPRGYCLIIFNVPELEPIAKQLESVFIQMYFKVDLKPDQTSTQIEDLFSGLTGNKDYEDYNALVTYFIGHGMDGQIQGSDRALVPVPELLQRCGENSPGENYFEDKPKIHVFDCCRSEYSSKFNYLVQN